MSADHGLERAQVLAAIDAAQRALDEARALVTGTAAAASTAASGTSAPDWQRLKVAAHHCKVHTETMARWAVAHGLGRRIDRAWWIDMIRLKAWQNGESYTPIPPETASFRVKPDAEDPAATAE